jgi:hypothetical protein
MPVTECLPVDAENPWHRAGSDTKSSKPKALRPLFLIRTFSVGRLLVVIIMVVEWSLLLTIRSLFTTTCFMF